MSALTLPGAVALLLVWLAMAVAGWWRPRAALWGALAASGAGVALVLAWWVAGEPAAAMALPVGLPGIPAMMALDGLSAPFLLLVLIEGMAGCAAALDAPERHCAVVLPLLLAAMGVCLLAGDGFVLALGLGLMALAGGAALAGAADTRMAARWLALALFAQVCVAAAFGLLGGWDTGFALLRGHPLHGWPASVVAALALAGAGAMAGLAPFQRWLPAAQARLPGAATALLSGAMSRVALYVLIRLSFDLAGPLPAWWGLALLTAGAVSALLGAVRANLAGDINEIACWATIANGGLVVIALGLAIVARAADLPALAGLALTAALLLAVAHGLLVALLLLGAEAIARAAGSRRLDRLGGLLGAMPFTGAAMLAAAAGLAALPPGPGFAALWALVEALIGGLRAGGPWLHLPIAAAAAVVALSVALLAMAALRLAGIALLGRARTPAAAAREAGPPMRWALLGLGGASLLVGVFPGLVPGLADGALARLAGGAPVSAFGAIAAPVAGGAGYAPLFALVALLLAGALVWWGTRRFAAPGYRRAPAWADGGGEQVAPMSGDPADQLTGAGLAQPLQDALDQMMAGGRDRFDTPPPGETWPARIVAGRTAGVRRVMAGALGARRLVGWLQPRNGVAALVVVVLIGLMLIAAGAP